MATGTSLSSYLEAQILNWGQGHRVRRSASNALRGALYRRPH